MPSSYSSQQAPESNDEGLHIPRLALLLSAGRPNRPESLFRPRPGLMMLTAVFAILAWLLFGGPLHPTNFALPTAVASSKLDNEVIEAPAWVTEAPPLPVAEEEIQLAALEPPAAPAAPALPPTEPEPVAEDPLPEPVSEASLPPPMVEEPLPEPKQLPSDLPPGETPMITPKNLTVRIVLAGWFLGVPAMADDKEKPGTPPPPTNGQMADSFQKLDRHMGDLADRVKRLTESLDAIGKQVDSLTTLSVQVQDNTREISNVKQDIKRLNEEVARLRIAPEPRVSQYPTGPAPQPISSQIQLVNSWIEPMTVVVDGISHRLNPNESKMIPKAAAGFNYEVLGLQPPRTISFLNPGETFTVKIGPQARAIP